MNRMQWRKVLSFLALGVWCLLPRAVRADPPAQGLPSALLVFPYVEGGGGTDTRIELVNLTGSPQLLNCFYVNNCNEIGFLVSLTPYQPLAWLATNGLNDTVSGSAVPPFFGTGEMKCAVMPAQPAVQFHNTMQGRATVFDSGGGTVSYNAVGFQRLTDGDFTGVLPLDGITYAPCPDKLHFDVLTDTPTSTSDMILVPCSQDLLTQTPTTITVQYLIFNEFEQPFSTSKAITCFDRRALSDIAGGLTRATAGSDTAHVIVRGSNGPLIGLVVDSVPFGAVTGIAGNEPSLQGSRSATVIFP
jgi:hypothetical protein